MLRTELPLVNLGHSVSIPRTSGLRFPVACALRLPLACGGSGGGWLAVPFTISRCSRCQGQRAMHALASWRPSLNL